MALNNVYAVNTCKQQVQVDFNGAFQPPTLQGVANASKLPTSSQPFSYVSSKDPKGQFGNTNELRTSFEDGAIWEYQIDLGAGDYSDDLQLYIYRGWVVLTEGGVPVGSTDEPIHGQLTVSPTA